MRDLSVAQFEKKCREYGFTRDGFLGYFNLGIPNQSVHVSILNAGPKRRSQLAYLIQQRDKHLKGPVKP